MRCAFESFRKCDSSHTTTWNRFCASAPAIFPTSEYGTMANVAPSIFFASAPLPTAATVARRDARAAFAPALPASEASGPSHFTKACSQAPRRDVGTRINTGHSSR